MHFFMLKATLSQPLKHIICFLTHFNVEMFDYILAMMAFFYLNKQEEEKVWRLQITVA